MFQAVQTCTFRLVKMWMTLKILLGKWYRSLFTQTTHYESKKFRVKADGTRDPETDHASPGWTDEFHPFAIEEVTRYREDGRTDLRIALWHHYAGRVAYHHHELFVNTFPPPWLSIRCDDVDYTSVLAPYVCRNNRITLSFLRTISRVGTWTYLSPTTFEDTEFPSSGITI